MKILLVSATEMEVTNLLKLVDSPITTGNNITCTYKTHTIDFLTTGIGMVATTYQLTKALRNSYDLVINVGICGSFNRNLDLGDVVHIIQDEFSELGVENDEIFLSLSDINLQGETCVKDKLTFKNSVLNNIPKVTGITVNTVHGNEASIDKVFSKFHPYTESMEGAAFMYVCQHENVQFAQIRAVSNYVEKRNKANWNIALAIENSTQKVFEIIDSL